MEGTDNEVVGEPLVEPRLVRFLKDRPRVVDKGVRREFLEQLEENIRERRRPDTAAERAVQKMFRTFEDAGTGVAKDRTKKAMDRANKGPLKRL